MMFINKNKKGFTLIELLVVVAIMGLLSSIVLVAIGPTRFKGKDAKRKAELRQIYTAMEACYNYGGSCAGAVNDYPPIAVGGLNALGTIDSDSDPHLLVPVPPGYTWTVNTAAPANMYYCVYALMESKANTYFCASNKGVKEKTYGVGILPSNADCCGDNVTI